MSGCRFSVFQTTSHDARRFGAVANGIMTAVVSFLLLIISSLVEMGADLRWLLVVSACALLAIAIAGLIASRLLDVVKQGTSTEF